MKFTINNKDLEYQEFDSKYPTQGAFLSVIFKSDDEEWNEQHHLRFDLTEDFFNHDGEIKTTVVCMSKSSNKGNPCYENLFCEWFDHQIDIHSDEAIKVMKRDITRYLEDRGHSVEFVGF